MRPRRKQKMKWSPELAYAVGLIATDGSLSVDGHHIILVSKDIQLLKTFKEILNLKNQIGTKKSGYTGKKNCHYIQFGDVIFYKWLQEIGLTTNKTKTIKELKIPDEYFFDFLRGLLDGDGGCYGYWDKRWESSFMFYIYLYSGSSHFLEWIRDVLKRLLNIRGAFSHEEAVWKLKYAKSESKLLFSKMYYKENLPYLKRKYIKLRSLLNIDSRETN